MKFKLYPWRYSIWAFRLLGLGVLSLLNTAAEVMTTSGRHTPSELLAQFSDGILSNVTF